LLFHRRHFPFSLGCFIMGEEHIVRCRGLPWSCTAEQLRDFFEGCNILNGEEGIHFTYVRDGRPSGEAYIEFETQEDYDNALEMHKKNMGKRYVEVFKSDTNEMESNVRRSGQNQKESNDAVVRLRGLPYGCSREEIAYFFTGLEIAPNGISLLHDNQGRTTGEAFVQFAHQDLAERAMNKHKDKIGHRYIEIFKSSMSELKNSPHMADRFGGGDNGGGGFARSLMGINFGMGGRNMMGRPGPYDRMDRMERNFNMGGMGRGRGNIKGFFDDPFDDFEDFVPFGGRNMKGMGGGNMRGGNMRGGNMGRNFNNFDESTGYTVHMRGLPFQCTEEDINKFFQPFSPVGIFIKMQDDGRASGEADADFATHEDAEEAMTKDKNTIKHRYIELFLRSSYNNNRRSGNNFGGMDDYDDSFSSGFGNRGMGNGFNGSRKDNRTIIRM